MFGVHREVIIRVKQRKQAKRVTFDASVFSLELQFVKPPCQMDISVLPHSYESKAWRQKPALWRSNINPYQKHKLRHLHDSNLPPFVLFHATPSLPLQHFSSRPSKTNITSRLNKELVHQLIQLCLLYLVPLHLLEASSWKHYCDL
ncbi:hypothetical protein ACFX1X_021444 [Malus domestica]